MFLKSINLTKKNVVPLKKRVTVNAQRTLVNNKILSLQLRKNSLFSEL